MIQTVTGKIQPSQLGVCAAHEHLTIDLSRIKKDPDTILDDEDGMRAELDAFYRAGGRAMVEVTNDGMGRNAPLLARLSRESGVWIIASTGFYKDPYLPEYAKNWNAEQFAEHINQEVRNGIDDTGIYPGVIGEVGSSHQEMKPIEEELLKGAGLAGIETGLPVTTHTTLGTLGVEQVELFSELGLPMNQLIIGHQDLNSNRQEVLEVAKSGAFVAFDTIGKTNYRSDEDRLDSLLYLWENGYGSQILLSADLTRKSHWKKHGGPGYDLVLTSFVPRLKEAGLKDADIEQMLVKNPAEAFSIKEGQL
ncbi:phosphotriesterase family protein [Natribacillus halophilus]|uniref:Phosphotriesterase-related protein n=1 Tax=Natribacillus halophilus TaxID=549003 RepID=A0A1G8N408_9BACI|nr:phosphotriesterase [Natribacillus halophilus]SDI75031.1 phosphotriesterase-related protein [Natribacillus halophilus]